MKTTKILWSGLTGRTGQEAVIAAKKMSDVEIVMGMTRHDVNRVIDIFGCNIEGTEWIGYDLNPIELAELVKQRSDVDVIVDFSHPDCLDKVVELAVRTHVPLISGTSGLSNRQMAMLYDATNQIPVFRGGNFCFKVKKFIDEVVKLAAGSKDMVLKESFYAGKSLPSETAKVIQRRVYAATGKHLDVFSDTPYTRESLIREWVFDTDDTSTSCKVSGFYGLAHDVLEIAKIMADKPVKKGDFYDLDEIWDELPH